MNLGQASKHFTFIKNKAIGFFDGLKKGDTIEFSESFKDFFFDLTF